MARRRSLTESIAGGSDEFHQSLEDSVGVTSDEYHRFQCSLCNKEGKNVAAETYCVDCDQSLCMTCLNQHSKFGGMKKHQLVENAFKANGDKQRGKRLELPCQRCEAHHGKLLDVFCKDHKEVCCGTCVSIHHSSCTSLSYIPMTAEATDIFKDGDEMLEKNKTLQCSADNMVKRRRVQIENLKDEKSKLANEIEETCSRIIDHFITLKTNTLKKLDNKCTSLEETLNSEISKTIEILKSLEIEQQLLTKYQSESNTSSLFVQLILAAKRHLDCSRTLEQLQPFSLFLEFSLNNKARFIVDEIHTLGDIVENKTISSCSLHGDFNLRTPNDKSTCDITDIIIHHDGTIFVTDFENKCLKCLDSQYHVVKSAVLPGKPKSICFVDKLTAAIALTDVGRIQFVGIKENITLTTSFKVGDHCRGVAYGNGHIYVTCGGKSRLGEGRGRLEAYSLSGKHLKTFDTDLSVPQQIFIHKNGDLMYVRDYNKVFVFISADCRNLKRLAFNDIVKPMAICSGPRFQYFMGCYYSSAIVLLSENDFQLYTLKVEGVKNLQALRFDPRQSRLIVAMDTSDTVKVLDLTFE